MTPSPDIPASGMMTENNLDHAWVSLARRPEGLRGGADIKPLPPRLWEMLRQELQAEYRRATGETQAVLIVEDCP